jgi:hypothetical protein
MALQNSVQHKQMVIEKLETELVFMRAAAEAVTKPQDTSEALKRLTDVLQRWAERNRAIEPAEIKKVLTELHPQSRLQQVMQELASRETALLEQNAELSQLKQRQAELQARLSADLPLGPLVPETGKGRQKDTELEQLKSLLRDQERALRQKEDELKKLQDLLKKDGNQKPKNPGGGE